jgi:hypothetical protein
MTWLRSQLLTVELGREGVRLDQICLIETEAFCQMLRPDPAHYNFAHGRFRLVKPENTL